MSGCQSAADSADLTLVSPSELPFDAIIIRNGSIIDGSGAEPVPDGLVAFKEGAIIAVGPEREFQYSLDAHIINAKGGTILPGVIDTHSHILESTLEKNDPLQATLEDWLKAGVTTIRDLTSRYGADETPSLSITTLHERLTRYGDRTPTLIVSGPILTVPGGFPTANNRTVALEITDVNAARQATQTLIEDGAGVIKIAVESGRSENPMPTLSLEQITAISETAHQHNVRVAAHVLRLEDAQLAVAGGVDELAHNILFGRLPDELIQQMVQQEIAVLPTLRYEDIIIRTLSLNDQEKELFVENWRDNLGRFLEAGGKVALASVYDVPGISAGMPVAEMSLMIDFGMTPMQVIVASTSVAAEMLGLEEQLGTLEEGKKADIIVVNGDPLEDIGVMENVTIVVKNGEVVARP
jgi:imidazolonepropionase-like amidohydrolase